MRYLLGNLGLSNMLLDLNDIITYTSELSDWSQLLRPDLLFSVLFYFGSALAIFQIAFVFPFRLFKKLIRYPSRKACEK